MAQSVEHIVHIDGVTGSSPVATTTNPCSIKLARVFSCLEKMKIFILDRRKRTESITLFTSKNR